MATQNAKVKKSGGMFLYIAIIFIGIIGGYFYYAQIIVPSKEPITLPDIPRDDSLSKFKNPESFDFRIFSQNSFQSLKTLGEAPVQPGTTGRDDVFAPF